MGEKNGEKKINKIRLALLSGAILYSSDNYLINNVFCSNTGVTTLNSSSAKYTGVVNATALNVRSGGSVSYKVIGGLKKNAKVEIFEKLSNGWYKIKYNSGYGYVNGSYIRNLTSVNSLSSSTVSSVTVKYTATVNTDVLNVRSWVLHLIEL